MEGLVVHSGIQTRRLAWWGAILSILLGVSVFAWGLGYKLSLYDPPQSAAHPVPVAKLLSKDEQPALAAPSTELLREALRAGTHSAPFAGVLALRAAVLLGRLPSAHYQRRDRAHFPLRGADHPAFFIRPPPAV